LKRFLCLALVLISLTGCKQNENGLEIALRLRDSLLSSKSCSFVGKVTAEFSERAYCFKMNCQYSSDQELEFSVLEPNTISGITGSVSQEGGKITFDEKALLFETMADGRISPVSAPWLMMKSITSGYIKGAGDCPEGYLVQIDDSYREKVLKLLITLDHSGMPLFCEIFWEGVRIVSIEIENLIIL
jgi:hypothetical protein